MGMVVTNTCTHVHDTQHVYAIAFSAGLNPFQLDQVNREIDNQTSVYTQLVSTL